MVDSCKHVRHAWHSQSHCPMPLGDFLGAQWKQVAAQSGRGRYSKVLSQQGVCKANRFFQISYQLIEEKMRMSHLQSKFPDFFMFFEAIINPTFHSGGAGLGPLIDFQLRQIRTTCFFGKRIQAQMFIMISEAIRGSKGIVTWFSSWLVFCFKLNRKKTDESFPRSKSYLWGRSFWVIHNRGNFVHLNLP